MYNLPNCLIDIPVCDLGYKQVSYNNTDIEISENMAKQQSHETQNVIVDMLSICVSLTQLSVLHWMHLGYSDNEGIGLIPANGQVL